MEELIKKRHSEKFKELPRFEKIAVIMMIIGLLLLMINMVIEIISPDFLINLFKLSKVSFGKYLFVVMVLFMGPSLILSIKGLFQRLKRLKRH